MRPLSKTAENKLIAAIESAASLVNGGMSPNDAIVKSATDANIPPGHLELMVHAYNTGRTAKQRESSDATLEKAANFALADIGAIRGTMFSKQASTSAEIQLKQAVSTEYAVSPAPLIKRAAKTQTQAAAPLTLTFTPAPRDEHAAAMRAHSEKRAAQRRAEEARREVNEVYYKAAMRFEDLVTYFKTPGHVPYPDVIKDVQLTHGDHGVLVMKKLAGMYPELEKEAASNVRIMLDKQAREIVNDVLELVDRYNDLSATYYENEAPKLASAQVARKENKPDTFTGSVLSALADSPITLKAAATPPVFPPPSGSSAPRIETFFNDDGQEYKAQWNPASSSWDQVGGLKKLPKPSGSGGGGGSSTPFISKDFNLLTSPVKFLGEQIGIGAEKGEGGKPTGTPGQAQYNELSDPEHERAIKDIRAKSVLHDLVLNDPVISGYDPQDVAMAFNDVAELAPNLVDTPGMLQTVLRKRLESGQLADFDVKQILEMDKLRAERDKIQGEARRINMEGM